MFAVNLVEEPAAPASPSPASVLAPEALPPSFDANEPAIREGSWSSIRRHLRNIALGFLAAGIAVLLRYALPLPPDVLPFVLVVIAVCLITVGAGLLGGLTTMIVADCSPGTIS